MKDRGTKMPNSYGDKDHQPILEIIQTFFAGLRIADARPRFQVANSFRMKLLDFAIKNDVVTGQQIREWLHSRLLAVGRDSYDQHLNKGEYPDHTVSPHCLAYAIAYGEITPQEAAKIKFGHGETVRTFFSKAEENLLQNIWKSIVEEMIKQRKTITAPEDRLLSLISDTEKVAAQ